jgi:uncharacterized protein
MPQWSISPALLEILVCPVCHGKVDAAPQIKNQTDVVSPSLHCRGCGRYYPIQDGIPVMLETHATLLPPRAGS